MTTASKAIERSVSHNDIVTVDADSEGNIIAELTPMCDDHVEANGVHEFWGQDDDGNEWRVHVRLA